MRRAGFAISFVTILFFVIAIDRASSSGVQAQPLQPATITSSAELVLVPVHVQRHGQHVSGLTKDGFTVLQDGKPQKVAVFEEIKTTTERLRPVPLPAGEFTNELEGNANAARYTVIAIDRINTRTFDMHRLRDGLLKFLKAAADSGEPIRLVAVNLSRIEVIQDFTTDPKLIADALQKAAAPAGKVDPTGERSMRADDIVEMTMAAQALAKQQVDPEALYVAVDLMQKSARETADFVDRSSRLSALDGLQQLALSLAGLPGRKSIVWASSGYPFTGVPGELALGNPVFQPGAPANWRAGNSFAHAGEAIGLDEYTTHLLSTANIAVYPVDVRGVVNDAYESINPAGEAKSSLQALQARSQDVTTAFERLAGGTGGKTCLGREDVSGCFKEAMDDEREYYVAGYYLNRKDVEPGWHKISVKVSEPGVSVRARNGFLLESFTPSQAKTMDVKLELASHLLAVALPFRGRWLDPLPSASKGKKAVPLELRIPPSANLVPEGQSHLNVEVAAVARRRDGAVAGQFGEHVESDVPAAGMAQIRKDGITYRHNLDVAPGVYIVRIVVRDNNSGRMGSVSTVLTVQ